MIKCQVWLKGKGKKKEHPSSISSFQSKRNLINGQNDYRKKLLEKNWAVNMSLVLIFFTSPNYDFDS